jgi:hypothetical protein
MIPSHPLFTPKNPNQSCRACKHWNTEPFDTQCDGSPISGLPQMGCCMGPHLGCTRPGDSCLAWQAHPLTAVCSLCHQIIGPDHHRTGHYMVVPNLISHGLCLECAPAYCRSQGLTEQETSRIIASAQTPKP